MSRDSAGRTPRQAALDEIALALDRVRWDHPQRDSYVEEALVALRSRALTVQIGAKVLQMMPLPGVNLRRVKQRTPFSVQVVRYLDGLSPTGKERLVRDAYKKANPRWTVPSS